MFHDDIIIKFEYDKPTDINILIDWSVFKKNPIPLYKTNIDNKEKNVDNEKRDGCSFPFFSYYYNKFYNADSLVYAIMLPETNNDIILKMCGRVRYSIDMIDLWKSAYEFKTILPIIKNDNKIIIPFEHGINTGRIDELHLEQFNDDDYNNIVCIRGLIICMDSLRNITRIYGNTDDFGDNYIIRYGTYTKIDNIHYEGYFYSKHMHTCTYKYPVPLPMDKKVDEELIEKIYNFLDDKKGTHYLGFSCCRICGKTNGDFEYHITKNGEKWTIPEGYMHYVTEHNVMPSNEFIKMINDE
jgi:hypothetical protein